MVTMNSDKAAARRRPEPNSGTCTVASSNDETAIVTCQTASAAEESPNHLLYKKVFINYLFNMMNFYTFFCRWKRL